MAITLRQSDPDFETRFAAFLATKRESSPDVDATVRDIIARVRAEGDAALIDYTKRFDRADLTALGIAVTGDEIAAAYDAADPETVEALKFARDRIRSHHARQKPADDRYVDAAGVELGSRWTAIEAAGLYVPGGTASYPSSVLMNAIPASVAGVERSSSWCWRPAASSTCWCWSRPTSRRLRNLLRRRRAGRRSSPMAPRRSARWPRSSGRATPMAAAKRQVFGTVGIDMIAGPSEVLVVADRDNDPDWIAADLLAQAEHDASAQSILLTDDAAFAASVEAAVERQLLTLPRAETAAASWRDFGGVILVDDLFAAIPLVDRIAAEHVELALADAETFLSRMRNAGAVFLGSHTPEAIGDYVGGSNHVLPTARSAASRRASPCSTS